MQRAPGRCLCREGHTRRKAERSACDISVSWGGLLRPKMQGVYQNVIASLRDLYGTVTTSLAPSVILSSVKESDAVSSTPVTGCASWLGVGSIRGKETPWTSTHSSSASPR